VLAFDFFLAFRLPINPPK